MFSWLVLPRVGNRQHLMCGPESVDVPGRGTAVGREGREFMGRQCGTNRAGREGRKQTAHPDVWGVGVWCVLHLVVPGPTKAGRAQREAGQVQGRGALLGPTQTGTGDPTSWKGRLHQNPPVWGVGGVENRKRRGKKKKRETKQKKRREGAKCVCVPGQGETEMLPGCVLFHFKLPAGLRVFSSKQSWN